MPAGTFRRTAVACLTAGSLLAVGTPLYLSYAVPGLSGYLLHPVILLIQLAPFLLCAALWLPWRAPAAARTAFVLSALLLLGGIAVYAPMLRAPGARGGDMIGLAFVAISLATTGAVLLASAVAAVVIRLLARRAAARAEVTLDA